MTSSIAVDCDDGNRGGCEHVCYKDKCICPLCWTLEENELDCIPDQSKIRLNCSPSGIALLVEQCVVRGERTLSLLDTNLGEK